MYGVLCVYTWLLIKLPYPRLPKVISINFIENEVELLHLWALEDTCDHSRRRLQYNAFLY